MLQSDIGKTSNASAVKSIVLKMSKGKHPNELISQLLVTTNNTLSIHVVIKWFFGTAVVSYRE